MLNVCSAPRLTLTFPAGAMLPLGPVVATMVFFLLSRVASRSASRSRRKRISAASATVYRLVLIGGGVVEEIGEDVKSGLGEAAKLGLEDGVSDGLAEDVGDELGEVVADEVGEGFVEDVEDGV